jgi:endoglucanase
MKLVALAAAAAIAGPLYADPDSNAARQATKYENQGRTTAARLMRSMSNVPQAFWLTGGTPREVRRDVDRIVDRATAAEAVAVLVAYNVPGRDCGGYSAGGARNYGRWIDGFARGINRRPAVVIVEPDALASGCGARYIKNALKRLEKLKAADVYVDAGHSHWQPAATMARRLRQVKAQRYSLNVSNFRTTQELIEYGTQISTTMHFVIDTSRNGQGPRGDRWCNPPGRGLGQPPTSATGHPLVDAFLWIKTPGESDGECGKAPPAGHWWPRYALGLAGRANPPLP